MKTYEDNKFYTLGYIEGDDPIYEFYKDTKTITKKQYSSEEATKILAEAAGYKIVNTNYSSSEHDWERDSHGNQKKNEIDGNMFEIFVSEDGHFAGWYVRVNNGCKPYSDATYYKGLLLLPEYADKPYRIKFETNSTIYGSSSVYSFRVSMSIEKKEQD